jgi:hypothetical protein
MNATLTVADLEAHIHALSADDKIRIARFVEREVSLPAEDDVTLPDWMRVELERREKLAAEGKMENHPWEEVRERLLKRFQK